MPIDEKQIWLEEPDAENPYDHLTNSRPLQWDRTWCDAAGLRLVGHLMERLEAHEKLTGARERARKATDRALVIEAFEAITADLFAAWARDPELWLAYPRRREEYGRTVERYDPTKRSLTSVVTVVDFLQAEGLVEQRRGSYQRRQNPFAAGEIGTGYRTRMRATPIFAELMELGFGLSHQDLSFATWREGIRLKSAATDPGGKRLIDYQETTETERMRSNLELINDEISRHVCRCARPLPVDLSANRLYRVFNNGSFDQGGRFYGGWWQTLNASGRALILIDGQPTVELDFVGLHPRMIYDLEGVAMAEPFDPYAIPGFEGPELRKLIKLAFNQLVNISDRKLPRAPKGARALLGKRRYPSLLEAIERAHASVVQWFRSGRGLELQRLDSVIAEQVMLDLQGQGICCLPVHDSFIVPASGEASLRAAMIHAYQSLLRHRTGRDCMPLINPPPSTPSQALNGGEKEGVPTGS